MACLAFRVRIIKIEWSRILFATPADWRVEVAIYYAGGLFAALCLSITYVLVSRFTTRLSYRVTQRTSLFGSFVLIIKTAVLANLMIEFTNGIFEGTARDAYVQIGYNSPIMIFVIFFSISLGIQIMHTRNIARVSAMPSQSKDVYVCNKCGYILRKKDAVVSGWDAEHSSTRVHCPRCGKIIARCVK